MKIRLKHWLRPLIYTFLRWLAKAQGSLWDRSVPLADNQSGLDIGCGPRKRLGFMGADKYPALGVDLLCDLERGQLPFGNNTFDLVYANHVLEHIDNLEGLLVELARIMKPGARLQVSVPYAGDLRAFQDPTHVRFFTLKTLEYFIQEGSRVGGWYLPKCFKRVSRRRLVFGKDPLSLLMAMLINQNLILLDIYESSILRIVPARNLQIELEK